ncbi:MAG TPA: alpha/beta fold hydrolase [Terriglobales bacterium]|nr:alpha/beta fold hydrolase [Terriglobales bacterium]
MKAEIDDAEIYYIEMGERLAPAIVLIHGFPFTHAMWNPQIEFLKSHFRIIAYDIRGHGKSDVGDGQYSLELFVDDLIGLLDHLQLEKVVLCGLSMGGYIALRAIERNPERFRALILCDTTSNADSNEAKLRRAASIKTVKRAGVVPYAQEFLKAVLTPQNIQDKPDLVHTVLSMIESNSSVGICGTLLALAGRTDTTPSLPRIQVPTLILVGEQDKITPPDLSKKMHALIKNSKLQILPNAAHLSNLEEPEEFNEHILDFLKKVN